MNRRIFLKKSLAATAVLAGPGLWVSSCTRNLRSELMGQPPIAGSLNHKVWKILYYASLAPSGHNSQPWFVEIINETEWIIGSDEKRWLPRVDNTNREVMLSLGAFIENLVQAAAVGGFHADVEVIARDRFDPHIARVTLTCAVPVDIPLSRLLKRRTVKSHLLPGELKAIDVTAFSKVVPGHLYYFPRGSSHSDHMATQAVANFEHQFKNERAVQETADWTRLSDKDARKFRDGLTTDGMEITGIAGWFVRNFMDRQDVMGDSFRLKGIEKTKKQAGQGAGWLVITSDGTSVKALLECGRHFQRMALLAREKMIGLHPMTQTLEEKAGQKNIRDNHGPGTIPQFMLRVGYLDKYPDPLSLRRPVDWFLKLPGSDA